MAQISTIALALVLLALPAFSSESSCNEWKGKFDDPLAKEYPEYQEFLCRVFEHGMDRVAIGILESLLEKTEDSRVALKLFSAKRQLSSVTPPDVTKLLTIIAKNNNSSLTGDAYYQLGEYYLPHRQKQAQVFFEAASMYGNRYALLRLIEDDWGGLVVDRGYWLAVLKARCPKDFENVIARRKDLELSLSDVHPDPELFGVVADCLLDDQD